MPAASRSLVLHLHLHQPPREDPFLGEVAEVREAFPDHDWTARVERTCYRPLVAARVLDGDGRIARVASTLAWTSFAAAPQLLGWMERAAPQTYAAVLHADREGARRLGHGNAVAQPYDHVILPLASRRDKRTEVRWGMADFRRRFGREPEGFWLPECAADDETLDVLAECGVRFTFVAPHGLRAPDGSADLGDGQARRWRGGGGRELALVPYHAALSHDVAFGGLLRDGRAWARRLLDEGLHAPEDGADGEPRLLTIATRAETFGHHHVYGEMGLAGMLVAVTAHDHVRVENAAAWLARHPATREAVLEGHSSWSCPHGVERWRADCGCRLDPSTHQRWRTPLREAVEALADTLDARLAREGPALLGDPWAARDAYLGAAIGAVPESPDPVWARELLEMARETLRLRLADAWQGDDVADEGARIVLGHAARALRLAGPAGTGLERAFVDALGVAEGNDPVLRTARDVYLRHARPALPAPVRVAAGWAAVRAVRASEAAGVPAAWIVRPDPVTGHVTIADRRLLAESTFAVTVDVPSPPMGEGQLQRLADVDPRGITILARAVDAPEKDGVPGAMGAALKLSDVPERARRAVELALRQAVVDRLLDDEERARLAAGAATLGELASEALVRAVVALAHDGSPAAAARALGLADLAESAGAGTPFDAQTALWRLHGTLDEDGRARLAPVAWRLGFSLRAWRRAPDPSRRADVAILPDAPPHAGRPGG